LNPAVSDHFRFVGKVTHLSQKGMGVVRHEKADLTYFISGTWPGDVGEFEVSDRPLNNKKFGFARLLRLIEPSTERVDPLCPYHGENGTGCSGCPWMIARYSSQLEQKRNRLLYALTRVGIDATQLTVLPVHPAPQLFGYRNRFQVKTDGRRLGYVIEGTHDLMPIGDCLVLNPACGNLLKAMVASLPRVDWLPSEGRDWNFIDLDDEMTVDQIQLNQKRSFRQGNTAQNEVIKAWLVQKLAECDSSGKAVELFCGSGNFTEIIAQAGFSEIIACESDFTAIQMLKARQFERVSARQVNLFQPLIWKILRKAVANAKILILDPPRAGLSNMRGFFEAFSKLKRIYYISCDPETFARDAKVFTQQGWVIRELQPIDLFPHTPHVEILAFFEKV